VAPTRNDRAAREARQRLRAFSARQTVHERARRRRRIDYIAAIAAGVVLIAVAATGQVLYGTVGPGKPAGKSSATPSASASASATAGTNVGDIPKPTAATEKTLTGSLTLNQVALKISLDGAAAPQGVAVLADEAKSGYLVGKVCHRVVVSTSANLIQCGALNEQGGDAKDYSFGPIENAPKGGVYPAGTIALARVGGDAYSQGHQFFITTTDTTLPDDAAGGYTVVGTVTGGLDQLISQIVSKGTSASGGDGAPKVATKITAFTLD
jgi:peptidyl-prolyl cis-trans isomerase B (cyclophilin B)